MFYIVKVDGFIISAIDTANKPNKYGKPKEFPTKAAAQKWIDKNSYKGMSYHYEIRNNL